MITKTLINRYLALAMTLVFTSAAVWADAVAPTPVATWTDFSSFTPGTALSLPSNEGNHNLSIPANAQLADDGAIVIGSTGGLSINYTGSKLVTFELEVSNVPSDDKVPAGILLGNNAVILQSNDGSLYQRATSSMGTNYGSYDWDPSIKQTITIAYSGPNGNIQGTQTYINGESVIGRAGGLRWSTTDISELRIGFQYSNVRLATGMKVHAIRVYSTRLSDEDVAAAYEAKLPKLPEVISININQVPNNDNKGYDYYQIDESETYTTLNGDIPASAWNVVNKNETPNTTATANKVYLNGETLSSYAIDVEINAEGANNYGCNDTHHLRLGEDSISQAYKYLGIFATVWDNTAINNGYVKLDNIPYQHYDVYLYFQSGPKAKAGATLTGLPSVKISSGNAALDSTKYYPAKENGEPDVDNSQESSTATHWGERQTKIPELGKNVMVVRGCTGTFKAEYQMQVFGPAAIQIVNNTDKIQIDCEDNYRISTANATEPIPDILCFNSGSTLIVDEEPTKRYVVTSEGLVTVRGTEGHPLTQSDVDKIALANDSEGIKYVFTSVPEGLAAPAAGITYRFDGLTDVAAPLFGNTAFNGTVEYINTTFAGIAIPGHTVSDGHQRYVFGEGCSATAERWVLSNQSAWASGRKNYLDVVQEGGTITLTKEYDQDSATMNDTANSTLVLAHYNSVMTYALTGGVLDASAGTVGFGRDGSAIMTIGGGESTATFKALGISRNNRVNESSLTILPNGVLELGKWGVNFAANKSLILSGGTLGAVDNNTITSSTTPITLTDGTTSIIDVAAEKTMTINATFAGNGTIKKTGAGILDIGTNRPTMNVVEGKVKFTATEDEIGQGVIALTVPEGATEASTDKVIVVKATSSGYEEVSITGASISGTTLTLTIDSLKITGKTKISDFIAENNLNSESIGTISIVGTRSAETAYDVEFDTALPAGISLHVSGYVNFKGTGVTSFSAASLDLATNAALSIDKPFDDEFTIKAHTTLAIDGEVNSTHRILVESFYSTLKVNPGATLSFDLEEAGNPIQNTDLTDQRTNGSFELYGTLDFGANDWTHNFYGIFGDDTNDMHCAISLYGGAKITGTGTMIRQGGELARYFIKDSTGEDKYATIDIAMSDGYEGFDTIFDFEEGAGLKISKANSRLAEHQKLRGTIGYFEALDGETYTLMHEEEADFVSKIDGIVYVNEGDTLKLEELTDASVIVKMGAGVLDIGAQAVAVKIEAGKVKVLAASDNLAEKRIVLPLPSGVTEVSKANYMVVDVQGNEVEIDTAMVFLDTITLILDSLPLINASTLISALNLPETASGLLIIEGGNSAENAITLTFDQALPEGVTMSMKGFVRFVPTSSVDIPYGKMTFEEGCTLMFDTIDGYTIPEGAIVIAGTASGNIVNNGTLTITGGGTFKLTNAANKTVRFTGGTSTVTADQQDLKGVIEIARGATFVNGSTDAMWYGGAVTVKVWGKLDMAATRWSMGANNKVIAYDGAVITGAGQGANGSFDPIDNNMTYLLVSNEGLAEGATGTVTNSAPTRVRKACKVEVAENMTLVNNGRFINYGGNALNKTGAGKLVQSANLETTGAITVEAGTLELNASAGSTVSVASNITGAGDFIVSGEGTISVKQITNTGTRTFNGGKLQLNDTTILCGTLKNDGTINDDANTANLGTHFISQSGTNTIKWKGNGSQPVCDNDSIDDPFITVNSGTTLNIFGHDYSGWNGGLRSTGWIKNNGTLVFQNEAGTRFFREHLVIGNGAITKIDHGANPLLLYGGAGTVDACQIMLPTGSATISAGVAGDNACMHLGNNAGGGYGDKGIGISVGENATLTIDVPIKTNKENDNMTKWGQGRLTLNGALNDLASKIILKEGEIAVKSTCGLAENKIESGIEEYIINAKTEGDYTIYSLVVAKVRVQIPTIEGATISSVTSGGNTVNVTEDGGKYYVDAKVNQKLEVTYQPQTGMYIKNGVVSIVPTSDGANKIDISGVEVSNTPLANMPVVIKEKKGTKIRVAGLSEDGCAAPGTTLNISVALREGYEDLAVTINGSNFTEGEEYFTLDYDVDSSESEIVIITDCTKITE